LRGFCETLTEELVAEDSAEFRTMFRWDKVSFDNLMYTVGPSIEKAQTTMRQTISAKARLLGTLRFLATGIESYMFVAANIQCGAKK